MAVSSCRPSGRRRVGRASWRSTASVGARLVVALAVVAGAVTVVGARAQTATPFPRPLLAFVPTASSGR